jgi:CSLREA domain-containing protein
MLRFGFVLFVFFLIPVYASGAAIDATVTPNTASTSELNTVMLTTASAQTDSILIVNTTDDPGDGTCTEDHCSLREAINQANSDGVDTTINFSIPGTGPHIIAPTLELPTITAPVTINGLSEPDIPGGTCPLPNGALAIQIDGSNTSILSDVTGLTLGAGSDGSSIQGLSVTNFGGDSALSVAGSDNNLITCNYIGVAANGAIAGGSFYGIFVGTGSNNTIDGNVIAHHRHNGVHIVVNSNHNAVRNNIIHSNEEIGVAFFNNSNNNLVQNNAIYANGITGVEVSGPVVGNRITQNAIYNNTNLGINLTPPFDVNTNDGGDGDGGANNSQNYPVISNVTTDGSSTQVSGSLDSNTGTYTVEFFSSPTCDASDHGEGEVYLGATSVNIPGGTFNATRLPATTAGHFITATAIKESGDGGSEGDTSEFSACVAVISTNVAPILSGLALTPNPVNEGAPVTLSGTATDANEANTLTLTVNWGDGSPNTVQVVNNGVPFNIPHTYSTPTTYSVTVTVSDGIEQEVDTLSMTVSDVLPTGTVEPSEAAPPEPQAPTIPARVFECVNLATQSANAMVANNGNGGIQIDDVYGNLYCHLIAVRGSYITAPYEIGVQSVIDLGVYHAVDVFGLLPDGRSVVLFEHPLELCLQGSGDVLFLSAMDTIRRAQRLPFYQQQGYVCVNVPHAGTVVLVTTGEGAAPLPAPQPASTGLSDCRVTTLNAPLNLRAEPSTDAAVLHVLPYDLTLTATAYVPGWYQVIYLDGQGWVSARYLRTAGSCGE